MFFEKSNIHVMKTVYKVRVEFPMKHEKYCIEFDYQQQINIKDSEEEKLLKVLVFTCIIIIICSM